MDATNTRRANVETCAQAWSEPDEALRLGLLRQAASPSCAYADPNAELEGHASISAYMAGFQQSAPGARLVNTAFMTHHDRCILQWNMVDRNDKVLSPGVSAGTFDEQGRLAQMVGSFEA